MNWQHVRTFCAIAVEGSFSAAAEALHLTQPTLSAQMQALERSLGGRLFERGPKGVKLTEAGEVFHEYALQLVELMERAEQAMADLRGLARGRLRAGASTVPGHYLLPGALAAFKVEAPQVELSLRVGNSQDIRAGVRSGELDLGVIGDPKPDARLSLAPLVNDHLVAVVTPQHPLARRRAISRADLLAHPFVSREPGSGTRATLWRALEQAGVDARKLSILLELGSNEAVKMAVRATDSVAVLSEWCVHDEVDQGLLTALPVSDLDLERRLWLVWRGKGYLSVASEAFIRHLRRYVAQTPSLTRKWSIAAD